MKMLRVYNTAFYSSNNWGFNSEPFSKFSKSWNVNLTILYDLPHSTHCWIVEELSEGKHFKQMVFSRFLKYIKSIANNKRASLRCLYRLIKDYVRTLTGGNTRQIFLETKVDPRTSSSHVQKNWRMYPQLDNWTVPLLRNLIEVRGGNWEVVYDDEAEECVTDEELNFMINGICTV